MTELQASRRNGVYLLEIEKATRCYVVRSLDDMVALNNIKINGNYVSVREKMETECDDFEIEDKTINLIYDT